MSNESTFRPKSNLIWGATALLLDATFLAQVILYPSKGQNLFLDVVVAAAIAAAIVLIWIKPRLILNEDHLVVVNPLRTVRIEYARITGLDTKWALTIHQDNQSVSVWVAPVNGKHRWIADSTYRWSINKMPNSDRATGESTPASQSLGSDSGVAAELIRQRIAALH